MRVEISSFLSTRRTVAMSIDQSSHEGSIGPCLEGRVSISKWVNEALPPWSEMLSSHDVARLTRRHRWILSALSLMRCFPRKRYFHGRPVGWHRRDVARWLERHHGGGRASVMPMPVNLSLPFPAHAVAPTPHLPLRHAGRRTGRRRRPASSKRAQPMNRPMDHGGREDRRGTRSRD
jgi:hypothetical protein